MPQIPRRRARKSHRRGAPSLPVAAALLLLAAPTLTVEPAWAQQGREPAAAGWSVEALTAVDPLDDRLELERALAADLRRDPDNAAALRKIGALRFGFGDWSGAAAAYERAHALAPDERTALALAEALFREGRAARALQVLGRETTGDWALSDALRLRGEILLAGGRVDEAEAVFRRMLAGRVGPLGAAAARLGLVRASLIRGRPRRAEASLDALLAEAPRYAPGWLMRGRLGLATGRRHGALTALRRAVALEPADPAARVALARAELLHGDRAAARAEARALSRLAPRHPALPRLAAEALLSEGRAKEAATAFKQIPPRLRATPPLQRLGAAIAMAGGRLDEAEQRLSRALAADSDDRAARRAEAELRLRRGDAEGADARLSRLLDGGPEGAAPDPRTLWWAALARIEAGRYEPARAALRGLAGAALGGRGGEARRLSALLDAFGPKDAPAAFAVAAKAALGRAPSARAEAERLLERRDGDAPARVLVGHVAAAAGDARRAERAYRTALDRDPDFTLALDYWEAFDRSQGRADRIEPRLRRRARTAGVALALRLSEQRLRAGDPRGALAAVAPRARADEDAPARSPQERARLAAARLRALSAAAVDPTAAEGAEQPGGRRAAWRAAAHDLAEAAFEAEDPTTLSRAARALLAAEDAAGALDAATRAVALSAGSGPVWAAAEILRARAQTALGDKAAARLAAERAFERARPRDGREAHALLRAALRLAVDVGDKTAAMRLAARWRPIDDAAATVLEAEAERRGGQAEAAVRRLAGALQERPSSAIALALFRERLSARREAEAIAGLRAWKRAHPQDVAALAAYGAAMLERGRHAEAEAVYRRLLRLTPQDPAALNNYALARARLGRWDALDLAERAYRMRPADARIADTYGRLLSEAGRAEPALAVLREAVAGAPGARRIRYHLALAEARAGRRRAAMATLSGLVSDGEPFQDRAAAARLLAALRAHAATDPLTDPAAGPAGD